MTLPIVSFFEVPWCPPGNTMRTERGHCRTLSPIPANIAGRPFVEFIVCSIPVHNLFSLCLCRQCRVLFSRIRRFSGRVFLRFGSSFLLRFILGRICYIRIVFRFFVRKRILVRLVPTAAEIFFLFGIKHNWPEEKGPPSRNPAPWHNLSGPPEASGVRAQDAI